MTLPKLLAKLFMKSPHAQSGPESNSHTNETCLNTIPNKHLLTPECITRTQPDNTAVLLHAGSVLLHLQIPEYRFGWSQYLPIDCINRMVIMSL